MKLFQGLGTSDLWILGGFIAFVLLVGGGETDSSPDPAKKSQPLVQKSSIQSEPVFDGFDDDYDLEDPDSWTEDEDLESDREEEGDDTGEVAKRKDVIEEVEPSPDSLSPERERPEPAEVALKTSEPEALVEKNVPSEDPISEPNPFLGDNDLEEFGEYADELREYVNSEEFGAEYAD